MAHLEEEMWQWAQMSEECSLRGLVRQVPGTSGRRVQPHSQLAAVASW
jgi:hypothetical protein